MNSAQFIISIIFVFPAVSLIMGALGYYIFKNIYITPIIIAMVTVIAIFTVFNYTFWFWAALYTLLSFLSGLIVKLLFSKKPT
ncbi:DUF2651 family protein [Lentibacillus sp. CBA3610]|uniref:DUF2651 family protein n=1 Tax=Lentibacillus sp. CBA3610 TaxID=2518176 RepID=UPI0015953669|nr:DUF2651 family protein [Lentibacillus sp. CBA3610]QKY69381.1 DUF2651 domain-containing protein [Lentibacillus sp. CBA3610]